MKYVFVIIIFLMINPLVWSQSNETRLRKDLYQIIKNWDAEDSIDEVINELKNNEFKFINYNKEVTNYGEIGYEVNFEEFKLEIGNQYGVTHHYHYIAFMFTDQNQFEIFKYLLGADPESLFNEDNDDDYYMFEFYIDEEIQKVVFLRTDLNF